MAEPAYVLPENREEWPAQGEWTWEDYQRLSDDGQRYEIVEGVLYVTPAPIYDHQLTSVEAAAQTRRPGVTELGQ